MSDIVVVILFSIISVFFMCVSIIVTMPGTLLWLSGKRVVDPFHITVYASHKADLKYIKLELHQLDNDFKKRLYPVYHFIDGKQFIPNMLHGKDSDLDAKDVCIYSICETLRVEYYQLVYAARKEGVYIDIDYDAVPPDNHDVEKARLYNAESISNTIVVYE